MIVGALLMMMAAGAAPGEPPSDFSPKEIRATMHDFARCTVGRHQRAAAEAILTTLVNQDILRRYEGLVDGNCLVAAGEGASLQMRFGGDLFRYALAEALIVKELAAVPPPDLGAIAPLAQRPEPGPVPDTGPGGRKLTARQAEAAQKAHDEALASTFLASYGECVVRADPGDSKALILSKADSPAEESVFGRMQPALSHCLVENHVVKFSKASLRGTIAVNYYRLAEAAIDAGALRGNGAH